MLGGVLVALHRDRRIGIRTALAIDEQRIALGVVLAALEVLRDVDLAAVGGAAFTDRDVQVFVNQFFAIVVRQVAALYYIFAFFHQE